MQRNVWMAICLMGALAGVGDLRAEGEIYRDTAYSFGERAVDLVSRMTLSEKAQQLLCGRAPRAPEIERLGVRQYEWWSEALHGVARDGTATSFPTGLGLGATWDPALVEQVGRVTSDEARDKFNDSESPHGLAYWSPTINLSRDPRWGRAEEAYGEDPYHTGRIACGFIHGMQGEHEPNGGGAYLKTFATPKHFLANNSEHNRLYGSSNLTEAALREYYTYAFKMAVEEGKAQSVMTSYNAVNGVPMSVNAPILDGILRRTWGFDGYVTTDCDTIQHILHRHTWRPEGWQGPWTLEGAVAASVRAGVDANCGRSVSCGILGAIKQGLLTEDDLDRALVRLFTARMRSGEFDPDGGPFGKINGCTHSAEAQALAQKTAEAAVVLLKNDGGFLPLTKTLGEKRSPRLVLVGQRADKLTLGDYSTHEPRHTSTILEGVRAAFLRHYPQGVFTYIRGGGGEAGDRRFLMNVRPPALLRADGGVVAQLDWRKASALHGCKVEEAGNLGYMEPGANPWVRFDALDLSEVKALQVPMAGPDNAFPTTMEIRQGAPDGTLMATVTQDKATGDWHTRYQTSLTPLIEGGYDCPQRDVYFVFKSAAHKKDALCPVSEAVIREADAVVVFADTMPGEGGFRENLDGKDLDLPRGQSDLIRQVVALNPKTAVYLQTVSQANVEPFRKDVKALLWSTYNGQAQGNAAGRLLFGEASPSARLPFTWYADVAQLAPITDYTLTASPAGEGAKAASRGRTYLYFTGDVVYPFGHGLTYASFAYEDLRLSADRLTPNDTLTATFTLTNTGAVAASEVPQLYMVSPDAGKGERPFKRLRAFQKITLAPGESRRVSLSVPLRELWFWDAAAKRQRYEPGRWLVQVGPDVATAALSQAFTLEGDLERRPHALIAIPSGHFLSAAKPEKHITVSASLSYTDQTVRRDVPFRYASSDPAVASVDPATGVVTAHRPGVATITTACEGLSATFPVCVRP